MRMLLFSSYSWILTDCMSFLLQVRYLEKEEVFSPEQIMGMLLTKLKTISEAELSTKVTDCVVSVSNSKRCLLEKFRSLHIVHICMML